MAQQVKLDLSLFKASGVYTLEFDASENIIINPQTIRLVVGYSNVGLFNTPVYCPDITTFQSVFGTIDKTLEKKGSFFHRSTLTCLQSGPVFALNLRLLNNSVDVNGDPDYAAGADVARYRAFSVDTEEQNGNNATGAYSDPLTKQDKLVSSYYNKEKFWFPSTEYFLATEDSSGAKPDSSKLFSIVNLGQNPMSVIVRKSLDSSFPLKGFDITAREYFGPDNVPTYMNQYDYLSDWFVDVIVISGNWTDYVSLSNDPVYSAYFTSKGFIKSQIDNFLSQDGVNIALTVTGTLIPNFVDQNGTLRYIQTLINNQTPTTGIFCSVNEEALDNILYNPSVFDLVGHHLVDELGPDADITPLPGVPKNLNFLSYSQNLFADFTYYKNVGGSTGGTEIQDTGASPSTGFDILPETGTLLQDALYTTSPDYGIPTSDFDTYSPSARDGGAIYIDTLFTNPATHDDQITTLDQFLTVSNTEPAVRWVLGKVTSNLPTPGYLGFYVGDLVKLRVVEAKNITNSTLAPAVQTQLRVRLAHPLINSSASITYVEPWTETNKNSSSDAYQFGTPDYFDNDDVFFSPDIPIGTDSYLAYENSPAYQDWVKGNIGDGDVDWQDDSGSSLQYLKFEKNIDRDGFSILVIRAFAEDTFSTPVVIATWDTTYISSLPVGTNQTTGESFNIVSIAGNISDYVDIITQLAPNLIELTIASSVSSGIKVGDLLVSTDIQIYDNPLTENLQSRLTRVIEVKRVASPGGSPGVYTIQVKTERPIQLYPGVTSRVWKFKSIQEFTRTLNFTYLPGSSIKPASVPNGTDTRMNEIYDVLTNTNLAKTLADTDVITFRYIVDTFDGGIQPNCKYQLTRLAKNRQKCMAICNAPSMAKFADSIDPRFTSAPSSTDPAPILQPRYIADGGNLSLNPSFTFSLPDEDLGAKFSGFFAPFLTIRENGKNLNVPPAAYVSNNFIRKFITGEPYSIVAGVKRGIISASNLVGLEYDFDIEDREYLEPFGINPIIRKRGIGVVIYGNQTSYQRTNSAFNNLHVRDLLITVESAIEQILSNYVFDFNEDSIRLEVKTLVDNYLTGVRSVGGIYNYLTIMDSSNNTPAIIDQNIGIIDVIIEPARGIHKFINRMTVTRTGGIASGGFIQFS
jgi:hypothetical protein